MESLLIASANLEKDAHSSLTSIERGLLMLKTHLEAFRRRCVRPSIQNPYPRASEIPHQSALRCRFAYHLRQWQIEGTGISSHLKALNEKQSLPLRIVCQPAGLPDKVKLSCLKIWFDKLTLFLINSRITPLCFPFSKFR